MSDPKVQKVEVAYRDDGSVREIYADSTRLVNFDGQTMHIELTVNRQVVVGENKSEPVIIPAARLVLPLGTAAQLRDFLTNVLTNLERQGVLKRVAAQPETRM
jgi:hypothetical protein